MPKYLKLFLIAAIVVLQSLSAFSQKRAMVWYFGDRCGLDFNNGNAEVISDGAIIADAGCASICNENGELLFYTNGNRVWNSEHQLMANGDTLNGSQQLNQNSIIVPKPLCDSLYYLFTLNDYDSLRGFNYSVININLENGLGKIVEKNVEVSKNVLEKITAIQHCNGFDYWIITHGKSNSFYTYLLSEQGFISDTIKSKVGSIPQADIGYLKASPAANKIVLPVNRDSILAEVFTFNNKTGKMSQPFKIFTKQENTYCYGVEFSSNGNLLYISTGGKKYELLQYDLRISLEQDFNNSAISIASGNNFALQMAPNNKIYIASENRPYLNIINNPNLIGDDCNFQTEAVKFSQATSLMGLPNFVQTWFYKPTFDFNNTCFLDSTEFTFFQYENMDSLVWNFGDDLEDYSFNNEDYFLFHMYDEIGLYNVELKSYHCGIEENIVEKVEIFPYPVSSLVSDTGICNNCTLVLDAGDGFDFYLWDDGGKNRYSTIYQEGVYFVEIGKNGCFSLDSSIVRKVEPQIIFPNAFTPNGDGLNDEFKVENTDNVVDFNMWIYNRRGEIVFQTNDVYQGWDGKYQGADCYHQTFVWNVVYTYLNQLGFKVEVSQKGIMTLIR